MKKDWSGHSGPSGQLPSREMALTTLSTFLGRRLTPNIFSYKESYKNVLDKNKIFNVDWAVKFKYFSIQSFSEPLGNGHNE